MRRTVHSVSLISTASTPVHDFSRPLRERKEARKHCGPYQWTPTQPGGGRGFYQSSKGLYCDRSGSIFSLRLSYANEHLTYHSRLSRIEGYYCDEHGDQTLSPIIARLPHGRGYLAGWTMGAGMCASIDLTIWADEREAAIAAHNLAEMDAETSRVAEALEDHTDNDNEEED